MSSRWPQAPISDLTEPETPVTYGVVKPGPEDPDGIPFIRGGDVADGRVAVEQLRTITAEVSEQYTRTLLRGGEIVVSLVGNPGEVAIVPESLRGANIARQVGLVRLCDAVDTRFVMYYLSSPAGQKALKGHSLGSVQKVINLRDLKTVLIPIPPLLEQQAIAHILGTLDDKIELNRRMNKTLEGIAQAIFKSWFVDFDPVRAKAEGQQPPGLAPEIADLFPDAFEQSELGEIPKGWKVCRVADVGKVVCGKTPSTRVPEYYGNDVPFIRIPDMHGRVFATKTNKMLSLTGAASQQNKTLPPGSICVSCIATPGLVVITTEESQTNQQINALIPQVSGETFFWYWTLIGLSDEIKARGGGGSVVTNLSTGRFSKLKIRSPSASLRSGYSSLVRPLLERVLANQRESCTLAALRDTLLPKLISGELRVPDGERVAAEYAS
jgi:type I restriction enzyme S subunit